ncbi:hypothetical protein GNI_099290 [Gregarina niphandrodes]|uniref:Cyclin n=1 Tax=Gregarina niphandrodes TaxID=110365 RepID=A0A023B4R5_GRENI|nr:hypothetical protein GNI_099290 [Gregarina niphandrodes]EZG57142.1 hypothetical protein GNI_099290 [Gregarina niphandrodes]|eukprot:XP_011131101.1 hypothetical protein GNI_099290 [Gregarina niphandrodes]
MHIFPQSCQKRIQATDQVSDDNKKLPVGAPSLVSIHNIHRAPGTKLDDNISFPADDTRAVTLATKDENAEQQLPQPSPAGEARNRPDGQADVDAQFMEGILMDDETDEDDNDYEYFETCGHVYTPPSMYLPLPKPGKEEDVVSPSTVRKRGLRTNSAQKRFKVQTCGAESKHLLIYSIKSRLPVHGQILDQYRQQCYALYASLPGSHTGAPILARLRRRLLRLAGHAIFAHHRGRHEVLFQTAFLFDLVICEFAKWIASVSESTGGNLELSAFLQEAATQQKHVTSTAGAAESLSRLTTAATVTTVEVSEVSGVIQHHLGLVSKEELRTVMMACLLLASKWNNSRYLPPDVLCSNPVGRVGLTALLEFEVSILSLFEFDIPFQTSAMNHLHLLLGTCEEDSTSNFANRLVCSTSLLILEVALCDYESLKISTEDLVRSAAWLGSVLSQNACALDPELPGPETFYSTSESWAAAVDFHMSNVEFEVKSAVSALPRLEEMGRWTSPAQPPNVFGVDLAKKPVFVCDLGNDMADAKTKTESLALAHLDAETSAAFDLLAAAALTEGQRLQYRVHSDNFERRCEMMEKVLALRKVRHKWLKVRSEISKRLQRATAE